jgi:iron complex transport system substrate-binding protein
LVVLLNVIVWLAEFPKEMFTFAAVVTLPIVPVVGVANMLANVYVPVVNCVADPLTQPWVKGPAVPDAQRVWRAMDAGVAAAAQSLPAQVRGTRAYFEVSQGPYAASEASFIGETLTRLGVKNIVPGTLGPFPKLNPEFIVRANPDLIMVGQDSAEGLTQRPGWRSIRAVRERRVCVFPAEQADVLVRPGPRMAEAARLMAQCLIDKAPPAAPAGARP